MTRPSVVIIGPCADPTDVGEALSTWRWARGLAEHADVTLLTYVKSGRTSAASTLPGVCVVEWDDLPVPDRFERLNAALAPGYGLFYVRARHWLKRALANGERIDLVHQLAPLALRYPSPAIGLGAPVVVGPLAGSLETPQGFEGETSGEPWYVKPPAPGSLQDFGHDPLLRRTYESAAVVIGVRPHYVRDVLGDLKLARVRAGEARPRIAELPDEVSRDPGARPFRLLFVGRIVPGERRSKDACACSGCSGGGPSIVGHRCRRPKATTSMPAAPRPARLGVAKRITCPRGASTRKRSTRFYAAGERVRLPELSRAEWECWVPERSNVVGPADGRRRSGWAARL